MLQINGLEDMKAAVLKNSFFKTQKDHTATHPFSPKVVEWLTLKNVATMPVVSMAVDFFIGIYLHDGILRRAPGYEKLDPSTNKKLWQPHDPAISKWAEAVEECHQETVDFLDKFMFTYLCAATAGELRHASSKIGTSWDTDLVEKWNIPLGGGVSRSSCQAMFLTKVEATKTPLYLQDAADCFNKYHWGGSFGGKKWGQIAETGLHRIIGKMDRITFIDRVFDLKHNGGPMFDKNKIVHQNYLPQFLDAKFALVKDSQWHKWIPFGTRKTSDLIIQAQKFDLWESKMSFDLPTIFDLQPEQNKAKKIAAGLPVDAVQPSMKAEDPKMSFDVGSTDCPKGKNHALNSQ